ncbi:DUF488 domain-containing protein [Sulfurovum sp. TSL1]|uniref:DUF488 domain-containing protein n=1 Tax=Sulfurovum sp. TSL1 TaxID=2826994 RepID=UPI001CC6096E|nr:DUF488 family protein [Sulfurovum sp. TSL1]GIT97735.1 hypothetical protein TSL1_05560 [Sulfurovum sp. TSL1]
MNIKIHRIYDDDVPQGYHVLVDRLWPRGVSKDEADLDGHWKDLAPSNDLRKWFDHDPDKWDDFRKKYLKELSKHKKQAKGHLEEVSQETLILLYGAKDKKHTHAHVLKEYLEKLK